MNKNYIIRMSSPFRTHGARIAPATVCSCLQPSFYAAQHRRQFDSDWAPDVPFSSSCVSGDKMGHGTVRTSSLGFALALVLTSLGLLAYTAVPKAHSSTHHGKVIHAGGTAVAAAAEAATARPQGVAGLDLSLLRHLLPLTNFSKLTTAELIDGAVAASLNQSDIRQLVQLHQNIFCAAKTHLQPLPGTIQVPFGNVSLTVYDGQDIVSDMLKGAFHSWEDAEVGEMLWALRQYGTAKQQAAAERLRQAKLVQGQEALQHVKQQLPLFVDVGANVGWFAINAAAAGARVSAFEAMPSNIVLIRRSLCANPWLAERVGLYGTGLGTTSSKCQIISGAANRGDGLTVCDQDVKQYIATLDNNGPDQYQVRGEMTVRRMDSIIAEDVQVMKIDVEGFELQVLEGAEALLKQYNVWYIMAECNGGIIKEEGQKKYLRFLDAMGYFISTSSFRGPFLSSEVISSGTASLLPNINLYCVKKVLLESDAGQQSTGTAATAGSTRSRRLW